MYDDDDELFESIEEFHSMMTEAAQIFCKLEFYKSLPNYGINTFRENGHILPNNAYDYEKYCYRNDFLDPLKVVTLQSNMNENYKRHHCFAYLIFTMLQDYGDDKAMNYLIRRESIFSKYTSIMNYMAKCIFYSDRNQLSQYVSIAYGHRTTNMASLFPSSTPF